MDKIVMNILIALLVIIGALTLVQIWVPVVSWDIFFKLAGSAAVIAVILGLIVILKSDLGEKKKMKDENYLD